MSGLPGGTAGTTHGSFSALVPKAVLGEGGCEGSGLGGCHFSEENPTERATSEFWGVWGPPGATVADSCPSPRWHRSLCPAPAPLPSRLLLLCPWRGAPQKPLLWDAGRGPSPGGWGLWGPPPPAHSCCTPTALLSPGFGRGGRARGRLEAGFLLLPLLRPRLVTFLLMLRDQVGTDQPSLHCCCPPVPHFLTAALARPGCGHWGHQQGLSEALTRKAGLAPEPAHRGAGRGVGSDLRASGLRRPRGRPLGRGQAGLASVSEGLGPSVGGP